MGDGVGPPARPSRRPGRTPTATTATGRSDGVIDRSRTSRAGGTRVGRRVPPHPRGRGGKRKPIREGRFPAPKAPPRPRGGTQDRGGPNSATELRREASAILRALSAARAAPGGLRATLGEEPALISRLLDALCAAGMLYQANALFREALDARVVASPFAVESLVRHGVKAGRAAEVAAAFDAYVAAGGSPTLRTYTDLITALSKRELQRRNRRSRQRFGDDKEHHDNTDVDAASGNRTSDAIDLWRALSTAETDDDALVPDAQAYTAAVGAFMAHGMVTEGDALVREMNRRGVAAGARLYNTLIAARGRLGDIDGVRAAERAMRDAGVRPNAATHGSRVAAYVRCGELELAERALRSGMGDRDEAKPTVHAYTALVQGLSRAGKVDEAREWIREMRRRRVPPNAHTYSTIVDALVRRGDVGGAEAVVEEMREDGVEPTAVTYNTLLKSCVSNRADESIATDSASRDFQRLSESSSKGGDDASSTSSSRERLNASTWTARGACWSPCAPRASTPPSSPTTPSSTRASKTANRPRPPWASSALWSPRGTGPTSSRTRRCSNTSVRTGTWWPPGGSWGRCGTIRACEPTPPLSTAWWTRSVERVYSRRRSVKYSR